MTCASAKHPSNAFCHRCFAPLHTRLAVGSTLPCRISLGAPYVDFGAGAAPFSAVATSRSKGATSRQPVLQGRSAMCYFGNQCSTDVAQCKCATFSAITWLLRASIGATSRTVLSSRNQGSYFAKASCTLPRQASLIVGGRAKQCATGSPQQCLRAYVAQQGATCLARRCYVAHSR